MRIGKYIIFEKEKPKEEFDFNVLRGHIFFIVKSYNTIAKSFKDIKLLPKIDLRGLPKTYSKRKKFLEAKFKKAVVYNKEVLKDYLDNLAIHIIELNNIFLKK